MFRVIQRLLKTRRDRGWWNKDFSPEIAEAGDFEGLREGFTFHPHGRYGFIFYREGGHVIALDWEMSGVSQFDILLSPLRTECWCFPRGVPIPDSKREEIEAGLRVFLEKSKLRADV